MTLFGCSSNMTFCLPTVLLKNRDPVLVVDCQIPRLKLFQFAQINLSEGGCQSERRQVQLLVSSRFTLIPCTNLNYISIKHCTYIYKFKVHLYPHLSCIAPTSISSRLTSHILAAICASLAGGEKRKEYNFIMAEEC